MIILHAENVVKYFPLKRSFIESMLGSKEKFVRAVDGVSLEIKKGEVFALVGESGSGKTTFGKLCLGIYRPTYGKIYFEGIDVSRLNEYELKSFRKKAQMIYQDPIAALNPRIRVGEAIREPLTFHEDGDKEGQKERVLRIMERVGLAPADEIYQRYPHELSGGQRQRVIIARALILQPEFIVADEPVAMLDVSIRAQILELLIELKKEYNLTLLMITHDLAIAKYFADTVAIMYLGKVVELGNKESIFKNPQHPYTLALLSSVPIPDPTRERKRLIIHGEVPSAINPPSGCRFHPRCPYVRSSCKINEQSLIEIESGHYVACEVLPFLKR